MTTKQVEPVDLFANQQRPTWCPGCGNFAIWTTLKKALARVGWQPHQVVIVFGIGCAGNGANDLRAYTIHGLHGRALPLATGIAAANPRLHVVVVGGDGDGYGEGLAHFIQTARINPNITYLVHDNQVFSLTKGQASPTSQPGMTTDTTPGGVVDIPLSPLALALAANASWIGRGFSGEIDQLESLMIDALNHRGFSYLDIFQPCVTFNHLNTFQWFYERVKKIASKDQDLTDRQVAWRLINQPDLLPIGLFYRQPRPILEEQYPFAAASTPHNRELQSFYQGWQ